MQVFCKYSEELELFLIQAVEYVISIYGNNLELDRLKAVELVRKEDYTYSTDGKTCDNGTKIVVTSRLYELLPNLDLQKLHGNEDFEALINTLYHEMIHVTDWKNMPILYSVVDEMDNSRYHLPGLFWLEYIAEKRSCVVERTSKMDLCEDFVNRNWRSYEFNYEDANEKNFYYLLKVIPYFMARTHDCKIRIEYLHKMKNTILRHFIEELDSEISNLERIGYFDDPEKLSGLYDVMDKYFRKFRRTFRYM